ncbi:MAG TPA: S8 family peptidase [Solirubrobacteraceae bacterium]|jgi:serine protease AprX
MSLTLSPAAWRWGRISWGGLLAAFAALAAAVALAGAGGASLAPPAASTAAPAGAPAPSLAALAARSPHRRVEVIVQLDRASSADATALVEAAGGRVTRRLELIHAVVARMPAAAAARLAQRPAVRAVSLNAKVESTGTVDPLKIKTSYNQSIRAEKAWSAGYTGKGVGVAVIDTGIAGDLPDFRVSQTDTHSRVIATAVVNPAAQNASDTFGHGTHIAGLIAGNGTDRDAADPLNGQYAGVAPDANLIAVKTDDGHGNATVADVIDGLQFVVDFKSTYNIRVVNLSLRSADAQSYKTDPLDAAVEQAWFAGIVVVAAAGNEGNNAGAVSYAPANDPYVITVGGVDDKGTKGISDDTLATWSSRGTTQDGFSKPDVVAPGAHLVSTLAPGADYASLCTGCVTDGQYFRVGGTSMAAGVVSGEVADLVQAFPGYTPNQLKALVVKRTRAVAPDTTTTDVLVDATGTPLLSSSTTTATVSGAEIALDKALANPTTESANAGLTPNQLIDPATLAIDFTRASWSRASWSDAIDPLRASWSRASWSRASWSRASWSATPQSCSDFERASWSRASWSDADIQWAKDQCVAMDPTRASWSRASWSRASWSSSFDK